MELTPLQHEMLAWLRLAVEGKPSRRVIYRTEWLGYLPFGLYHWLEANGQDISRTFPPGWCLDWIRTEMEALAETGLLMKVDEWRNPSDECDTKITYEVPRV